MTDPQDLLRAMLDADPRVPLRTMLDTHFALVEAVYKAFGYAEQWRAFVMEDARGSYWMRLGEDAIAWSPEAFSEEPIVDGSNLCTAGIYTYRHLEQYVFRAEGLVMALLDTQSDGNALLFVFDESKECLDKDLILCAKNHWG